jgi:hypothetical protein
MFFVIFGTMRNVFFCCLYVLTFQSDAQTMSSNSFGFAGGLLLRIGNKVNSVGLFAKGYYTHEFFQVNIGSTFRFNFTSYGKRNHFWENRCYVGGVILGGKRDNSIDFQLDGLAHQTMFRHGVAYNYIWYFDNIGTSQLSGGWGIHVNKLAVYFENDVFGGQAKDRFRTAHLLAALRFQQYKVETGLYLWTGETQGAIWQESKLKSCPNGFKDLRNLPFGKTSHGILYGGIRYDLGYGQNATVRVGVDSEHIRHAVQNRLIHDLIFLPSRFPRNTPHYPRLDQNGFPVFEREYVRKNVYYFQGGFNEDWAN